MFKNRIFSPGQIISFKKSFDFEKLNFKVKNARPGTNSTSIRLNAETLEIKGTQEALGIFHIAIEQNCVMIFHFSFQYRSFGCFHRKLSWALYWFISE